MPSVDIEYKNLKSTLVYNSNINGSVSYIIDSKSKELNGKVDDFLTKERMFRIPESQLEDDYRDDTALPTDEITYFELSLCVMESETDIKVIWPKSLTSKEIDDLIGP